MRISRRSVSGAVIGLGLLAPFTVDCAMVKSAHDVLRMTNCPDTSKIDAIEAFDFAGTFGLPTDLAIKLKTGVAAAAAMNGLADKIDADLLAACGGLASDLGDTTAYESGNLACAGAIKALADTKAKVGANASFALDVTEPTCAVDVNAYADCAAHCDPTVKPGMVAVECDGGRLEGNCSAQCKGDCQMAVAATCPGECDGTCDAKLSGTCDGSCAGTCDGKSSAAGARCAGDCEGTCSGNAEGTCAGRCGGSCKMTDGASCAGTCTGECSAPMDAPKCTGIVEPPQVNPNCKATCDAQVQSNASCTPPHVTLRITGALDDRAASALRAAIEKNLPRIVDVGKGMAKNIDDITGKMGPVIQGAKEVVQVALANKVKGAALGVCVAAPFAGVVMSTASVSANVKVSVELQATVAGGS